MIKTARAFWSQNESEVSYRRIAPSLLERSQPALGALQCRRNLLTDRRLQQL